MDRLISELTFWDNQFKNKQQWIKSLLDPVARTNCIPRPFLMFLSLVKDTPFVLDLGCGPISCLVGASGIKLVGMDPLAKEYDAILAKYGVPIQNNIIGKGETLDVIFPEQSFDIIHMRNALDHSEDPSRCIENIYRTLKVGGHFIIISKKNEGTTANWDGMHQWNLTLNNGTLVCTDKNKNSEDLMDGLKFTYVPGYETESKDWFSGVWKRG